MTDNNLVVRLVYNLERNTSGIRSRGQRDYASFIAPNAGVRSTKAAFYRQRIIIIRLKRRILLSSRDRIPHQV